MTNKNTGGPAFPRPKSPKGEYTDSDVPGAQTGMSLRDYFAAKALQAIIANDQLAGRIERDPQNKGLILGKVIAREAYALADNLIEERAK